MEKAFMQIKAMTNVMSRPVSDARSRYGRCSFFTARLISNCTANIPVMAGGA